MSEFEEELSSLPVSIVTNYGYYWNKAQLLTVFKDWHSPEHIEKEVQMKMLKANREKPQLFYLKNKITGNVLVYDESPKLSEVSELYATSGEFELEDYTFTKAEINTMQTGSYELVPVEDGE